MASPRIQAPKDFGAGILYLVLGVGGFFMALDYGVGSLARMGSGFFPLVLSALLALFGAMSLARSFMKPGEPIGGFGWKGLILVILATVAFGLLIRPAGLIVSLAVLILASAAASTRFKLEPLPLVGAAALVAFCAVLFVRLLGVPMPLLGYWFN
jgi:hypothetical protein